MQLIGSEHGPAPVIAVVMQLHLIVAMNIKYSTIAIIVGSLSWCLSFGIGWFILYLLLFFEKVPTTTPYLVSIIFTLVGCAILPIPGFVAALIAPTYHLLHAVIVGLMPAVFVGSYVLYARAYAIPKFVAANPNFKGVHVDSPGLGLIFYPVIGCLVGALIYKWLWKKSSQEPIA